MTSIKVATAIFLLAICFVTISEGFQGDKNVYKPPTTTTTKKPHKGGHKEKVYFNAYRTSDYTKDKTTITYSHVSANVGNGMNPGSGIFTAPKAGDYAFNFQAAKSGNPDLARVKLQVNGKTVATSVQTTPGLSATTYATLSISTILPLKAKDKVTVLLDAGKLHDTASEMYTHFSGILL